MRATSLMTGHPGLLDHLGILSICFDLPLIVSEEKTAKIARDFYPELRVVHRDLTELTLPFLAENFDFIFETGKFFAAELAPFLKLLFNKTIRFVYCPHGNSDKGYSLTTHVDQDISLVYGDHLLELLQRTGAAQKIRYLFKTGNYRYDYYLKNRAFYDLLAEGQVFQRFQGKKPIILYAPTWHNRENPTSFFASIEPLIQQLSSAFHLLIKLHPLLLDQFPAHLCLLLDRYQEDPDVYFLTDFPAIYPLLARCDIYLGDTSSIGYDFLAVDKPLYFLHECRKNAPSHLEETGLKVPLDRARAFIENSWEESKSRFQARREKLYAYAFSPSPCMQTLKQSIFNSLSIEKEAQIDDPVH